MTTLHGRRPLDANSADGVRLVPYHSGESPIHGDERAGTRRRRSWFSTDRRVAVVVFEMPSIMYLFDVWRAPLMLPPEGRRPDRAARRRDAQQGV